MSQRYSLPPFKFPNGEGSYEAIGLENETHIEKPKYEIRRKPIPSSNPQSFDLGSSKTIYSGSVDLDTPATTLRRDYLELTSSILMLILPVPFYVLAFYVGHMEGKDIESHQWKRLQDYMNAAVTAFPIVFAAIAGRATKKFAAWKLEDGVCMGNLEQLMGSTSFAGTLISIFSLRLCNALTPTLLLMWALSPLGGQSSLHLATTNPRYTSNNVSIVYFDTRSASIFAQNGQAIDLFLPTTNAVFQTSIMEPTSAMESVRDLWGSVKIPNLASIRSPDSLLSPNWTNITSNQNLEYSSLLGIPISGISRNGRTTMTIETSYFTLSQEGTQDIINLSGNQSVNLPAIHNIANGTWHWIVSDPRSQFFDPGLFMALDGFNAADGNYSMWYNVYERYSPDTEFVPQVPRHLAIFSSNYQYQRSYRLSVAYVETSIVCDGPNSCQATAIRSSQQPHINTNISNLAYYDTWINFGASMGSCVPTYQGGLATITEAYLNDPSNVAVTSISYESSTYKLTATDKQLQLRTQQLLNTYWQASVNPAVMIAGLSDNLNGFGAVGMRNTEGRHQTTGTVCHVNWPWWLTFIFATSVMFALAVFTLTIDCTLRGPEILGYCSSLLRDSPYAITTGRGAGSAMGGAECARVWKDVVVKLTDVRAGEKVGYIALTEVGEIGSLATERWRKRLPKDGRLYA